MNKTNMNVSPSSGPRPSAASIEALIAAEISAPSRTGYVLLLLLSLTSSSVVGSLLLTEVALPLRTRAAFAALLVIGLSWAAFAAWVLTRRRVLFARHRVYAGRMAVAFTSLFTIGAFAIGNWTPVGRYWLAAAGSGAVMLAAAVALLIRAHRHLSALDRRRIELEHQLRAAPKLSP